MEEIAFKRPELEDREIISSYFAKAPSRSCERTFANVYLWSRRYHVKYAIVEDALVFMDDEYALAYAYPAGDAPGSQMCVGAFDAVQQRQECAVPAL